MLSLPTCRSQLIQENLPEDTGLGLLKMQLVCKMFLKVTSPRVFKSEILPLKFHCSLKTGPIITLQWWIQGAPPPPTPLLSTPPPPPIPIPRPHGLKFSQLHAVFETFGENYMLASPAGGLARPPAEILDPPLLCTVGNFSIPG